MELTSKIYVAGHTGMVGSALLRRLVQKGYSNIITRDFDQLDLRRQDLVEAFFQQEKPEYVFLAAAKVGGILANDTYKAEFIYDNMMIAAHIIHASYQHNVKKLLNFGSSCIYPKFAPQPLKEDYLLSGHLEATNEPYAIAKIAALKLCRYYNDQYKTNFISVMPTNLYGPHDNFNLQTGHVLPALVRKFHLARLLELGDFDAIRDDLACHALGYGQVGRAPSDSQIITALETIGVSKKSVVLWGSGEPFREFLYVDDLATASIFLMQTHNYHDIGECINIGIGQDIKIKELAGLIKKIVGFTGQIIHDVTKPDGTPKKLLDVTRLHNLGWSHATSLEDGLYYVYDWYQKSSSVIKKERGCVMQQIFSYKSILITGGTGSFGKAFIKTILQKFPNLERVIVLSRDEFKQFEMSNMPDFKNNPKLRFFVGDVRDKDRLYRAFDGVDVVIHAAALKQVPSCEYNPFEAVKTNILGAQNVIDAAIDRKVKRVIALSTDKACAPINLYGATKLCSDKLFIAGNVYAGSHDTSFSVVRYGNVAGTRGSVIPFFKDLIAKGTKELPITDFRMTRFWLKLEDAVEMVLMALQVMQGGELFVKKIPSMKITDLAQAMAPDLAMREIGIRPGEKIHELMISREDAKDTIEFDTHYVIAPFFNSFADHYKTRVSNDFEYHSGNNTQWLSLEQMSTMIDELYPEEPLVDFEKRHAPKQHALF